MTIEVLRWWVTAAGARNRIRLTGPKRAVFDCFIWQAACWRPVQQAGYFGFGCIRSVLFWLRSLTAYPVKDLPGLVGEHQLLQRGGVVGGGSHPAGGAGR